MCLSGKDIDILQPLLANHLTFIATHRGAVHYRDDAIDVVGDAEFLSCWIPIGTNANLPTTTRVVRTVPWGGEGWPERLRASGFEAAEVLLYMEAPLRPAATGGVLDDVIEVASPGDALAFAEAQAGGFLDQDDEHNPWWRETFQRMALKNFPDLDQFFYLIRVDEAPAAVALVVRTNTLFGIYAVTTRPEFRRRGFSTTLLTRAQRDAVKRGGQRLTLQVFEGSYAERLYRTLGFTLAFRSPAYRRTG